MNTVIEKLMQTDENGNSFDISREEYQKKLVKELEVQPFFNEAAQKTIDPLKIVEHFVKNQMKGIDVDDTLAAAYPAINDRVREDLKTHEGLVNAAKAQAGKSKEEKEKEKAAAEVAEKAKAEALAVRQGGIITNAKAGVDTAAGEFKGQVSTLIAAIPKSITMVNEGNGYGLKFSEETTDEEAGQALGYVIQSSINNEFMGNQLKFFIGDMIIWYTAKGIFATAKEAAEAVNALLPPTEQQVPSMLDQWKKTAERTPIALRNSHVQPTAYLAVANMKLPKKGDKEEDAAFAKRLEGFKADRTALLEELSQGKKTKRADVLEPIEVLLVKHGLKDKKSDEDVVPIGNYYKIFFQTTIALEHFLSAHEKNKVIYKEGETKYQLTKEELEALRDEAQVNICNQVFADKKNEIEFKDIVTGEKTVMIKGVKSDGKGGAKKEDEEQILKVYPKPFWDVKAAEEAKKKEEEEAKAEAEEAAKAPDATPAPKEAEAATA